MMARRGLRTLLRAGIPALLAAIAISREGVVSIQVWIAAAAVWLAGTLLWDFITSAGIERDRRVAVWRSPRRESPAPAANSIGLQTVNLLLANAQANPRAHANNLRPRLLALTEHYLPIRHGFDVNRDPARVAELLDDVAWLIDPSVAERAPTPSEIERFLDIVLDEQPAADAGVARATEAR